jgi:hypothetical protein
MHDGTHEGMHDGTHEWILRAFGAIASIERSAEAAAASGGMASGGMVGGGMMGGGMMGGGMLPSFGGVLASHLLRSFGASDRHLPRVMVMVEGALNALHATRVLLPPALALSLHRAIERILFESRGHAYRRVSSAYGERYLLCLTTRYLLTTPASAKADGAGGERARSDSAADDGEGAGKAPIPILGARVAGSERLTALVMRRARALEVDVPHDGLGADLALAGELRTAVSALRTQLLTF